MESRLKGTPKMPTFLIGRMASFKDASGATVTHFERARGFGRSYWQDVTAKSKGAATRAVNKANARAKSKGDKNTSPFLPSPAKSMTPVRTCTIRSARPATCSTRRLASSISMRLVLVAAATPAPNATIACNSGTI